MGQPTQHHRFRFASVVTPVSVRGAAAPRTGSGELHRQCFANVSRCAGAQIRLRLACASYWHPSSTAVGDPQLRQSYITPHFRKCRAVIPLKLHLVPCTAARPHGFPKQALCKIAFAGPGLSAACTPQPLRVFRAVACRPCGVLALWLWSGAPRCVSVSGLRPFILCLPPPTLGARLLRSIARAVCPSAPPRGLPQNRAQDRRLSAAVTTTYIGRSLIVKTCSHTRITRYNYLVLQDPALRLPLCPALRGSIQVRLRPQTYPS